MERSRETASGKVRPAPGLWTACQTARTWVENWLAIEIEGVGGDGELMRIEEGTGDGSP